MNKKNLLIFGAGENQLSLINTAKKMGIKSVVIDPNPNSPGKVLADIFRIVAPDDYEETKKIALEYNVDGIVTSQMENPLRLMARLADDLGFTFPSRKVIEFSRNKYLMKKAFLSNGIPCAKGYLFKTRKEIDFINIINLCFPLVMKPVDSHSSRGVVVINNMDELKDNYHISSKYSSDGSVLVEEWLNGKEYSVEAITFKGETKIIQYTEKIVTPPPYAVEMGHIQPANLSIKQKAKIDRVVINAIEALGIKDSATHTELKISSSGIKIIEVGARLGGDFISSYLTLASTGINMDEAAILVALDMKPVLIQTKNRFSYIKYFKLPANLRVSIIRNPLFIQEQTELIYFKSFIKEGQIIPEITDSSKRTALCIISGDTRSAVINEMESLEYQYRSSIL